MEPIKRHPTTAGTEAAAWLLAFMFVYTAVSKVYDWKETRFALHNQGFSDWMTEVLLYGLPMAEILVAITLLTPSFRKLGFVGSTMLMTSFTGYVAWIWLGFAERIPCSCGGVISSLSWGEHLIFNLVFLGISVFGLRGWKVARMGSF